jgi:Zn-dependent peptidase ImmA (M78 family)
MTLLSGENLFSPSLLIWARRTRGMSVDTVAVKLGETFANVTPDLISKWEAGTAYPTPSHIQRLAEIYKRPTAVFLLSHHPDENPLPPDRRSYRGRERVAFSPDALLAIRRARRVQELAAELDEELGTTRRFPYRKHKSSDDPTELAAQLRTALGVALEDQAGFAKYSEFFEYLRHKLESTGLITLRTSGHNSFPTADARALSFTDRQPYLLLINNKDTEGAKNFSLLHEFGHILLREAGICDNFSSFTTTGGSIDRLEVFCNQFAADFLVPTQALLAHRAIGGRDRISIDELESIVQRLVRDFKVSRFVILRRLLTGELISAAMYKKKAAEWETEKLPPRKGGRTIPGKAAIVSNGISFSRLVYEAYHQQKISTSAAAEYLGMKARYLGAFEHELHSYGR